MLKSLSLFLLKHLRLIIGIVIVFILLYTLTLGRREKEVEQIDKEEKIQLLQMPSASGVIKAENKVLLHFLSSGEVVWIGVEKGENVSKGQALVSLDTTELKASLRQGEQDFIAAKAEVEKVYDETGRKVDESFSEKVKRTGSEAKQNKAFDSMKKIEKQIQESTLVSPTDGVVTDMQFSLGENVSPESTIEIVDFSSFIFKAEVDEADYGRVFLGQKVEIMLDAYKDEVLNGKVSFIGQKTEVSSSGFSFVPVEIEINLKVNLIEGLSGEAEFVEKNE